VFMLHRTETNETATAEIEHQMHHDDVEKNDAIAEEDESGEAAAGTAKQHDSTSPFMKPAADVWHFCIN
jgi:hypothetical protein